MSSSFIGLPMPPAAGLIGRSEMVQRATRLLIDECQDVAFVGIGGSGKSALANALCRVPVVNQVFADGIFWLGVGKPSSDKCRWSFQLADWARALGLSPERIQSAQESGHESLLDLVHESLAGRNSLLVFDDVWTNEEMLLFKDVGAHCRRVMTTRILGVGSAFSAAGCIRVEDLTDDEAFRLFERLAPEVMSYRPMTSAECINAVGRLPLVVLLVAKFLQSRFIDDPTSIEEAVGKVLDVRTRLTVSAPLSRSEISRLPDSSSKTLEAVINLSADALSVEHRVALTRLGAFPPKINSFSYAAAAAVAGSHDAVKDIFRTGLLDRIQSQNPERGRELRLAMHQTIHDYARATDLGHADAYRRMGEYFLQFLAQAEMGDNQRSDEWLASLDNERQNIHTALESAINRGDVKLALRLSIGLWDYWYRRCQYRHARGLITRILALPYSEGDREQALLRAHAQNNAGNFAYNMGLLREAEQHYRSALEARTALNEDSVRATMGNLGLVARETGQFAEAQSLFVSAFALNKGREDRYAMALNLDNMGLNAYRQGQLDKAVEYLMEARRLYEELLDPWGMAMVNSGIAEIYVDLARIDEARQIAISIVRGRWPAEDYKNTAVALRTIGRCELTSSDLGEHGVRNLLASLALSARVADRIGAHQTLHLLCEHYGAADEFACAARTVNILRLLHRSTGLVGSVPQELEFERITKIVATKLPDYRWFSNDPISDTSVTSEAEPDIDSLFETILVGSCPEDVIAAYVESTF